MFDKFKKLLYDLQNEYGVYRVRGEYYPEINLLVVYYYDFVVFKSTPEALYEMSLVTAKNRAKMAIRGIKKTKEFYNKGGWKHGISLS